MGRTGRFNGDQIIDIILEKPRTADHIAEKFWKEFVSNSRPDPRYIKQWATAFRKSNYNIITGLSKSNCNMITGFYK